MSISKITVGRQRMSDARLQEHALAVMTAMTGNTHFPDAQPLLTVLDDALKIFSDALAQAKTRHKVSVAFKNEVRVKLESALRKLSLFCSYIADGERSVLASSGFQISSEQRVTQSLFLPENFAVQLGNNSGEVLLSLNSVANAQAYIYQYGQAPVSDESWLHSSSSQSYITISGLEPLKHYSFKVTIVGRRGQTTTTDTITKPVV